MFSLLLGAIAAFPSYYLILWRSRTRLDDSLDVFAAHGVGGLTGALLTGVFAQQSINGIADGLLFGNPTQFIIQLGSVVAVLLYSGGITFGILKVLGLFMKIRATDKEEGIGLDLTYHGEEAYANGDGTVLLLDEEMNGDGASHGVHVKPARVAGA